ncbi:MAG: HD domain-containing protein [Defluviitaleaceae bacterium]|nr:HD domain-containing protein [Defluviitaleaceae bacterium]
MKVIGIDRDIFQDEEYLNLVSDLLALEDIQKLDEYSQHMNTSRLLHSVNVSYYTYKLCKKLGLDYRSGARAGLLHDFCLYDFKTTKVPGGHIKGHPKIALSNAKKFTKLNKVEKDAIAKHMWPLTFSPPRYKESYVLTFMDKYCAILEVCEKTSKKIKMKTKLT